MGIWVPVLNTHPTLSRTRWSHTGSNAHTHTHTLCPRPTGLFRTESCGTLHIKKLGNDCWLNWSLLQLDFKLDVRCSSLLLYEQKAKAHSSCPSKVLLCLAKYRFVGDPALPKTQWWMVTKLRIFFFCLAPDF